MSAIGDFQNPFINRRDDYAALTGLANFGRFRASTYNPLLAQKAVIDPATKQNRASVRAQKLAGRFTANGFNPNAYTKPRNALEIAMGSLAQDIQNITGRACMWDENGYMAYEIRDKYNNVSFSTNLTRLKRALMKGFPNDDGPAIVGLPPQASKATMVVATNRHWGVVIAWHKLLNAAKSYSPEYRARSNNENFARFAAKRVQGLTNRLYYLANNEAALAEYQAKATRTIDKVTNRYNNRLALINDIVNSLTPEARQAAAQQGAAQELAQGQGNNQANIIVNDAAANEAMVDEAALNQPAPRNT